MNDDSTCPILAGLRAANAHLIYELAHRGTCQKCLRECPP